jgi:hypothetical protein
MMNTDESRLEGGHIFKITRKTSVLPNNRKPPRIPSARRIAPRKERCKHDETRTEQEVCQMVVFFRSIWISFS